MRLDGNGRLVPHRTGVSMKDLRAERAERNASLCPDLRRSSRRRILLERLRRDLSFPQQRHLREESAR